MANSVLGTLKSQMEADKKQLLEIMAEGNARDHADYKYMCGQLLGLAKAQYHIDVMIDRLKQQEDL